MTGDMPPEEEECAMCGEPLVYDDAVIRLSHRTQGLGIEDIADYHSHCFMDVVNVDKDRPDDNWQGVSREEILNGSLKMDRVERTVIRPE